MVKDISVGGLRVETEQEPMVETIFTMELILEEKGISLQCKGRIAFCREKPEKRLKD